MMSPWHLFRGGRVSSLFEREWIRETIHNPIYSPIAADALLRHISLLRK